MIRAPMWGTSYWLEWTQYNDEYITEESLTSKKRQEIRTTLPSISSLLPQNTGTKSCANTPRDTQ